jgi:hypothetical protein
MCLIIDVPLKELPTVKNIRDCLFGQKFFLALNQIMLIEVGF